MKTIRIVSLILLILSAAISLDLLINLLGNMIPQINDGLGNHCIIFSTHLYFGDRLWSLERFYQAFVISATTTLVLSIENIVLSIFVIGKRSR